MTSAGWPRAAHGLTILALLLMLSCAACRPDPSATAVRYRCPMHPGVVSDRPGTCPICHMDLVRSDDPQTAAPVTGPADTVLRDRLPVTLDRLGVERAGIQTEPARRERLAQEVRTVGTVVPDEGRVHHLHLKVPGFVEQLFVNFEGQAVRAGQPVLTVYSPELLASQEEYVRARAAAERFARSTLPEVRQGGADLVAAARRRLELFDVPSAVIDRLDRGEAPERTVTITAPHTGYATGKEVYEGMRVEPGLELFTFTDLSQIWIEADVFEAEAPLIHTGQSARISLPHDPSVTLEAKVAYILPTVRSETRTLRVRFELANHRLQLKPGMFADVLLQLEPREALTVPESAVIDTGTRSVVFVAERSGRFQPRAVEVARRVQGRAEIVGGLQSGEEVVVAGTFLLDSESRLQATGSSVAGPSAPR